MTLWSSALLAGAMIVLPAPHPVARASIQVLTPASGDSICPQHGKMTVSWSYSGLPDSTLIDVDLVHDGQVTNHIFRHIPITPTHREWAEMYMSGQSGQNFKIRISTTDGAVVAESAGPFSLIHVAAGISLLSPAGGERWALGETQTIRWTTSGCSANGGWVSIFLHKGSAGSSWADYAHTAIGRISFQVSTGDGAYTWTVGDVKGGAIISPADDYRVEVLWSALGQSSTAESNPQRPWLSKASFSILPEGGGGAGNQPATLAPRSPALRATQMPRPGPVPVLPLAILMPQANDTWVLGQTREIQWRWSGDAKATATLYLRRNNALLGVLAESIRADRRAFSWAIPQSFQGRNLEPGGGYSVELVVRTPGEADQRTRSASFALARTRMPMPRK